MVQKVDELASPNGNAEASKDHVALVYILEDANAANGRFYDKTSHGIDIFTKAYACYTEHSTRLYRRNDDGELEVVQGCDD